MVRILLATICLIFLPLGSAQAQFSPGAEPVSVVITPEYPRPNQVITVSPRSNLIDLSASTVTVTANGANVYEGSGTQGIPVRVGGAGERTVIVVKATDASGQTYAREVVVRPAEVSLVMEPVSTSHPLYQGGGLVASEGRVRLIAVPDVRSAPNTRFSNASLVYTWRFGDQVLQSASGIGRSILVATAPVRYRDALITVTVTTPDSSVVAQAAVQVAPVDPIARIYQNDPLLGPNFDRALTGRFSMPDTEATLRAVGYFFGTNPTFAWEVGTSAGGADKDITVRATGSGGGTAMVTLTARDSARQQSAQTRVPVEFGSKSGGLGIFGL